MGSGVKPALLLGAAPAAAQETTGRGLAAAPLPSEQAGTIPRAVAKGGPAATVGPLIGALNNTGNTGNTGNTVNTSTPNTSAVSTR